MPEPLQGARLELRADADQDGTREDATFRMPSVDANPSIRTGHLIGGRGSTINNIIQQTVSGEDAQNSGFHLSLGGGAHIVELQFRGWEGSDAQWGASPDPGVQNQTSATGAAAITQLDVLMRYLLVGEYDSRQEASDTAVLHYGQYSDEGRYAGIPVAFEQPSFSKTRDEPSSFTGTITCLATGSFNEVVDALLRQPT